MATQPDATVDDGVFTIDTRPAPVAQNQSNRPVDGMPEFVRGPLQLRPTDLAGRAGASHRTLRAYEVEPEVTESPFIVQVGSVFLYAMTGAVMFHMGWWLLTG